MNQVTPPALPQSATANIAQYNPVEQVDFLLPRKQVEKQAGISRASIYRLIKAKKFPAPVNLGTGAVRWKQSDVKEQGIDEESVRRLTGADKFKATMPKLNPDEEYEKEMKVCLARLLPK